MSLKIVTANQLSDGSVVYLAEDDSWTAHPEAAAVAADAAAEAALVARGEEAAARHQVVAPYAIEVERTINAVVPLRYRELLRARGPSIRRDLGKQAERR